MFKTIDNENLFTEFMNKFTKTHKIIILIFGVTSGIIGTYLTWLDKVGRYEEMAVLFPFWLILQTPVYIVAVILDMPRCLFLPTTFIWWLLLGIWLGFIIIFLRNYLKSLHIE